MFEDVGARDQADTLRFVDEDRAGSENRRNGEVVRQLIYKMICRFGDDCRELIDSGSAVLIGDGRTGRCAASDGQQQWRVRAADEFADRERWHPYRPLARPPHREPNGHRER